MVSFKILTEISPSLEALLLLKIEILCLISSGESISKVSKLDCVVWGPKFFIADTVMLVINDVLKDFF